MRVLKKIFRKIPLFGPLADCPMSAHWNAVREMVTILTLSTVPLWLGSLLQFFVNHGTTWVEYETAFVSTVSGGELFLYCTSLLAPICWIALIDPPGARKFPSKLAHILLLFIINVIAAGVFGLQKGGQTLNYRVPLVFSYWLFAVSVVLLYLGTVYHNNRVPDFAGVFASEEDDYLERFRKEDNDE